MIHAKRQIDDARRILGTNYRHASMKPPCVGVDERLNWLRAHALAA
jgi:hypothetical protein